MFSLFTFICLSTVTRLLLELPSKTHSSIAQSTLHCAEVLTQNVDGNKNYINPISQVFTSLSDNESYTFKAAIQQEDMHHFVAAMIKELDAHEIRQHWVLRKQSEIGRHKTILDI